MKDWGNGITKCGVSYPTLAWILRQVERRGRGQVIPGSKSDNIAGFCCRYLLPSLVYSSVLVTLETAVGAYRGILLLCSCGQRCPVVHGKENPLVVQVDLQDEGNKVKTHCKISLPWLSCLAAGTVWQEWDAGENLAGGWIFMVLAELFKFFNRKVKISQQSVLRRLITAGLWTSDFYSVLRTMYWDVLLNSSETMSMTRNRILLYLFTCIRRKHPLRWKFAGFVWLAEN